MRVHCNMTSFSQDTSSDIYTAQYLLTYTIDYCSTQSLHLLVLCEVVVAMVGMTFTVADRAVWPTLPSASKSRMDTT